MAITAEYANEENSYIRRSDMPNLLIPVVSGNRHYQDIIVLGIEIAPFVNRSGGGDSRASGKAALVRRRRMAERAAVKAAENDDIVTAIKKIINKEKRT
jgi:hypothetical protein